MSEERRKRQEERKAAAESKSNLPQIALVIGIVLLVFGAAFYVVDRQRSTYDEFAKCLSQKQVKMYGLYWCTHCEEQKELFGASFKYVPYVECGIKGSRDEAPECLKEQIKNFPTWQFADGSRTEGAKTMTYLSDKTGCSLP